MTGDPTVLGMIKDNLDEIKREQKKVTSCMTNLKVKAENHELRITEVEKDEKKNQEDFVSHINNKKKHYSMGFKETLPQKMKRKAPEYTLLGIVVTISSGILITLIEHFMLQ